MPKAYSLHIGLNKVNPTQYEGWDGKVGKSTPSVKSTDFHKNRAIDYRDIAVSIFMKLF